MNRKEQIVRAAAQSFSLYGYDKTALEGIARSCGITKPAIYYHFRDKATLYEEVLCRAFEELSVRIYRATEGQGPREALEAYIRTFGEFLLDHPEFSALFARELAEGAQALPSRCIERLSRTLDRLGRILEAGSAEGVLCEENPFMVQLMIVSTLLNYQTTEALRGRIREALGRQNHRADPELADLLPRLVRSIIKALEC